jgi:drug/metabolite transporter (DMT)-like permease
MSIRRVIGIVTAFAGVAISIGHLVFGIFDRIPEKYHSHQAIVVTGFALAIGGLLLLGTDKRR